MQHIKIFSSHLQSRGLAKKTVNTYISALKAFATWLQHSHGEFKLLAATTLDVADYRRYLVNQGRKPATVNLALEVLNSFYAWAVAKGLISLNPVTGIKRMSEQKKSPRWLERKELNAFMRAVQVYGNLKEQALISLLLHTGLRVFEVCALLQEDLIIRERSGLVRVREGKGGKYREVPLNITIRRIMEIYIAETNSPWLFPGRKGHITTRTAERMVEKYARVSGVEVTPHVLRHTFGKMLVDAGESLDRVAMLMGHSNLNTTARYTQPSLQDMEKAVEKLAWE